MLDIVLGPTKSTIGLIVRVICSVHVLTLFSSFFSKFFLGYERPSTTSRPAECYYRLSLSQGNFTMPPPPYNVRDVRDCQWHIYKPYISASDPVIHLIFTSLFLQDGASVLVFDGQDKWAPVLKRFNGSEHVSKPMSLWSTGRDLLVKFTAPPYSLENRPLWIQFRATYHFEGELVSERYLVVGGCGSS